MSHLTPRQQLSSTLRGDLTQLASMVTIAPRLGAPGGSMAQPAGCIPLPTPVLLLALLNPFL